MIRDYVFVGGEAAGRVVGLPDDRPLMVPCRPRLTFDEGTYKSAMGPSADRYVPRTILVMPPEGCEGPAYPVLAMVWDQLPGDAPPPRASLAADPGQRADLIRQQAEFGAGDWLVRRFPGSTDWQMVGERAFRGHQSTWRPFAAPDVVMFVLWSPDWNAFVSHTVDSDFWRRFRDRVQPMVLGDLDAEMAYHLAPVCPVAPCEKKALYVFVATRPTRIAGRVLDKGDELWVCPDHADDVYRSTGAAADQLAPWLREASFYTPSAIPLRDPAL